MIIKHLQHWIHRFVFDTRVGDRLTRAVELLLGLALVDLDHIEAERYELTRRTDPEAPTAPGRG